MTSYIISVSDEQELWEACTKTIPAWRDQIKSNGAELVIEFKSPDIGLLVCGDLNSPKAGAEWRGVLSHLYDVFGGHKDDDDLIVLEWVQVVSVWPFDRDVWARMKRHGWAGRNVRFESCYKAITGEY